MNLNWFEAVMVEAACFFYNQTALKTLVVMAFLANCDCSWWIREIGFCQSLSWMQVLSPDLLLVPNRRQERLSTNRHRRSITNVTSRAPWRIQDFISDLHCLLLQLSCPSENILLIQFLLWLGSSGTTKNKLFTQEHPIFRTVQMCFCQQILNCREVDWETHGCLRSQCCTCRPKSRILP